jgi:hypothetical protein
MLPSTHDAPFDRPELVLPLPPKTVDWLIPDLVPRDHLVLLDGPTGVGKTRLAAAFAAAVTQTPHTSYRDASRVLWIADRLAFDDTAYPALHDHAATEGLVTLLPLDLSEMDEHSPDVLLQEFIDHLDETCERLTPRLVVLDGLEEQLPFLEELAAKELRAFYRNLKAIASLRHTTLLVLRRHGPHRPTQGGPVNRLGADAAPVNLLLAWHPNDNHHRLLLTTKNQFGPTGRQHLITIDTAARFTPTELPPASRIKPLTTPPLCIAPKPTRPNALVPVVAEKIIETLTAPMTAEALRTAIMALGFTYTAFRKAARFAGVRTVRRGDTWWYLFDHHAIPTLEKTKYATTTDEPPAAAPPQLTNDDDYTTTTDEQHPEDPGASPNPLEPNEDNYTITPHAQLSPPY